MFGLERETESGECGFSAVLCTAAAGFAVQHDHPTARVPSQLGRCARRPDSWSDGHTWLGYSLTLV